MLSAFQIRKRSKIYEINIFIFVCHLKKIGYLSFPESESGKGVCLDASDHLGCMHGLRCLSQWLPRLPGIMQQQLAGAGNLASTAFLSVRGCELMKVKVRLMSSFLEMELWLCHVVEELLRMLDQWQVLWSSGWVGKNERVFGQVGLFSLKDKVFCIPVWPCFEFLLILLPLCLSAGIVDAHSHT